MTEVIEDFGTAQIIVDTPTRSIAQLAAIGKLHLVVEVEQLARSLEPFVADQTASPIIQLMSSIILVRWAAKGRG